MSKNLTKVLSGFKAEERSTASAAGVLTKIVNDYCKEGLFDDYLAAHRDKAASYLPESQHRATMWRASSAGRCPQQQAYEALFKMIAGTTPGPTPMELGELEKMILAPLPASATNRRALWNGTFLHVRYHMMFDHLHELGRVRTVLAEEVGYDKVISLSGTVDRIIEFEWDGKTIRILLDFKSIKSEYYKDLVRAKPDHVKQITAYFLLKFKADWAMLLYENKDTHEINIQDVPYSELFVQALKDTYTMMNDWVAQMFNRVPLSERAKLPIITDWCRTCPYNRMCLVEHPERMEAVLDGLPEPGVF